MVVGLWFSAIVAYAQKVEEAGSQKENVSVEKGSDAPIFKEMTP